MTWAFTTVSATTTGNTNAAVNATTAVSIVLVGNYGISNSLWTDASVGGSVGATTLALRQNQSTTTAPTTAPVAGATFINSAVVHTITGYNAGTRTITFTPALTAAITDNVSITLNPALYPQALVVLTGSVTATVSGSVSSGATVTITAAGSTGNNFNSTNATSDYVGATFIAGGVTYTVTSATSTVLTVTPTITTTITGTINLTRQAVYYCQSVSSSAPNSVVSIYQVNAVFAGTSIPGITVPAVATGTSLTFYNPIFQQGTDTTIGTALAGLASIRSNVINAFVDHPSGGLTAYPIGAVQIRIDDGNGVVTAIRPSAPSTFIHNGDCYRVTSWDEANRLITFSPPLVVALTNNTPLSIVTPGVISNRNVRYSNTASTDAGLDSYLVNSIGVRVLGTLTWNAWAEQLILGSTCAPYDTSQAQLAILGVLTLNGSRSGWGLGSGSVCPTPALIGNLDGAGGAAFTSVINTSGSTITLNNVSIQMAAAIDIRVGTVNFNNATIVNSQGRTILGNSLFTGANTSVDKLTLSGFRWFAYYAANVSLQSIVFDNATPLFNANGLYFSEYISFSSINSGGNTDIVFRNDFAPTIGRYGSIFTNALLGGAITYSFFTDLSTLSGGLILARKDVAHSVKNITGANLSDAKVYLSDSLNGNHFDWQNRGIGLPTIIISGGGGTGAAAIPSRIVNGVIQSIQVIAPGSGYTSTPTVTISAPASGTTATVSAANITVSGGTITAIAVGNGGSGYTLSSLGADWNGSATRSYLWTTNSQGLGVSQRVILSTIINPNTRGATNLSARITTAANINDNQIQVDNRSGGLFSSPPQINGCFFIGTSRHIITGFSINGATSYTLTITPNLVASVAANTNILIENSLADYRNKTNIAAFIDHPSSGTYSAGATTIVIDNGFDARTTIQPTVNSNFIYSGTYHNITAVTPLPNSTNPTEWQLTIEPGLNASIANNQPLTLRNIAGQDFFDIDAASFPHLPQRLPDQNLAGTGTLTINWTLLDDPLIPVGTTLVNARTTPATDAISFYNLAKAWWYDNFESLTAAQRNTVFVTRSGSTLNAGSYNLILNSSVSPLFDFSNSTNTITLKTNTFTDTLTTTGIITLSQPGTYSSGIVPSGGKLVIAANGTYNLTGWTFANGSTIEDTATGTVNLSLNYEATAITNNSSGITLSNTGGGTLNVTYKTNTLSAPNFAADTKAYGASIISGAETQLFSTTLVSAGLTQTIELLTGTQVRVKAAYWSNASGSWVAGNFLDTTLSWSAQSGSSVASQIGAGNPDPSVTQTNRTTVEGYTSLTAAAQLYDRAKLHLYNNYTATNFTSAPLVTRTGTTLNAGSYNLTLATSGSVFALSGNTITINAPTFADTLTTTGTIALNNPSTTAINYASGIVPAGGNVALAVAGTYDLSGWTFASTGAPRTISNTSGGAVTVILRYDQIANITPANSQGSPLPSVKSKAVTFTGFPTANNANGVAPNPKFGLYSVANGWTFYDVSSGSVQVSLSEVGPESSFKAVTDAIGWIRPPEQTIQASRTDPFDWSDLYTEFTAEDGTAIIGAIPNPLPISYDAGNNRFELASGEELTFAEVAATKEALSSSETGIQNFNTEALRAIQFVSNSAYKRIILPNTFTVAMQAGATAGAVLSDFLLLRRNQAGTAYADPFAHGLTSTAPGLTDRPEVVTAFQNNIFVGATATEIRSAVGLGSANLDSQLGDITALVL